MQSHTVLGQGAFGCVLINPKNTEYVTKYGFKQNIENEYNNMKLLPISSIINFDTDLLELEEVNIKDYNILFEKCQSIKTIFNYKKKIDNFDPKSKSNYGDTTENLEDILSTLLHIERNELKDFEFIIYSLKMPNIKGKTIDNFFNILTSKKLILKPDTPEDFSEEMTFPYISEKDFFNLLKLLIYLFNEIKKLNKNNIYHNDLHEGNIIINSLKNKIYIIDFGFMSLNEPNKDRPKDKDALITIIKKLLFFGAYNHKIMNWIEKNNIYEIVENEKGMMELKYNMIDKELIKFLKYI